MLFAKVLIWSFQTVETTDTISKDECNKNLKNGNFARDDFQDDSKTIQLKVYEIF